MHRIYSERKIITHLPRVPLQGDLFLTYRCNNNCRHCWDRVADCRKERRKELSLEEIKSIVSQAKRSGTQEWSLSGGEPLLREDFLDIFMYIKENSRACSLNTNGTLITRKVAPLLRGPGVKLISLYGATEKIHDYITRRPGSFQETISGARYLKEANVYFIMQIIVLRDNLHELEKMVSLAKTLSKGCSFGDSWLYLSASGDPETNREIIRQRIPAEKSLRIDPFEEQCHGDEGRMLGREGNLFHFCDCIEGRRFFINPYGRMSFCYLIQKKDMFYNLRKGSFDNCWDVFLPSLSKKVKVDKEYLENCGSCDLRAHCFWCPGYAFLEHRRFGAKIDYLCAIAKKRSKLKEDKLSRRKLFELAGMRISVESDIPFFADSFSSEIKLFAIDSFSPKKVDISIKHHFSLPRINFATLGRLIYKKAPWEIYKRDDAWVYLLVGKCKGRRRISKVCVLNRDYTRARIYHKSPKVFMSRKVNSLYGIVSDQIFLSRIIAQRKGFYLHACGVSYKGEGFVFVGHSGAGKSTIAKILKGKAQILCDDRVIIKEVCGSLRLYGTWSHGEVEEVSPKGVPLKGVFFLGKAKQNCCIRLQDKKRIAFKLSGCLIKPLATSDWWEKVLNLVQKNASQSNFFMLYFNKKVNLEAVLEKIRGGRYD